MDEINKNLQKLQEEVSQINYVFQKQNNIMNNTSNYNINYLKILNNHIVRTIVLFFSICLILFISNPEFCYEEKINENTHFKYNEISKKKIIVTSVFFTAIFFYFTINLKF